MEGHDVLKSVLLYRRPICLGSSEKRSCELLSLLNQNGFRRNRVIFLRGWNDHWGHLSNESKIPLFCMIATNHISTASGGWNSRQTIRLGSIYRCRCEDSIDTTTWWHSNEKTGQSILESVRVYRFFVKQWRFNVSEHLIMLFLWIINDSEGETSRFWVWVRIKWNIALVLSFYIFLDFLSMTCSVPLFQGYLGAVAWLKAQASLAG